MSGSRARRPAPPRHVQESAPRRASRDLNRHRADVRPRYGRIAVLAVSVGTTAVALLGVVGVISSSGAHHDDAPAAIALDSVPAAPASQGLPRSEVSDPALPGASSDGSASTPMNTEGTVGLDTEALPADSGSGRRVVFSQALQRVWIVNADDHVERTYLVSGSLTDNLKSGSYHVFSRSMNAIGVDESGTMTHFVRFTQGPTGAAIGFHDIPVLDGHRIQTKAQLGTPQSHGCIRQAEGDAIAMWRFAQMGTDVVVV